MEILILAVCALAGYLVGNIQTSVLVSRAYYKDDVRHHGSGNAGTTNMLRVFGLGSGAITFIGDFLKGILSVLIGRWIAGEYGGYLAGLGAVLGHNFPVLFGFKGGKGVATTFGIAWLLCPICAAIITPFTFGLIFWKKMVSLGSLVGMTMYLILVCIFHWGNWWMVCTCCILWILIVFRHTDNIKRLVKGEESKLIQTKKSREKQIKEKQA